MPKPILVLDFDGVLHEYGLGFGGHEQAPNPPIFGAIQFLQDALNWFDVQIYSHRSATPRGIRVMQEWVRYWAEESAEFEVNEATGEVSPTDPAWTDEWLSRIGWPTVKPSAHVFIDDHAIPFSGSFPDAEELQYFKPWWIK